MKRKIALAFVFVTPGSVVSLGMAAYRRNRALLTGRAPGDSTETIEPVKTGRAPATARTDFSFSCAAGAPA